MPPKAANFRIMAPNQAYLLLRTACFTDCMVKTDILLLAIVVGLFFCAGSLPAQTIVLTEAQCAGLVQHQPAADVAYKPGVDVKGRAVAPADLSASQIALPKEYSIPITVDLQKRLGIPADPNQYQTSDFTVGTVTLKEGRAYFNGKPLQDDSTARLAALCQKR